VAKRCADDCETARHEQRGANPLECSSEDQLTDIGRKPAPDGRGCEKRDSRSVYAPAAINVAERSSNQDHRSEQKPVSLDYPLSIDHRRVQVRLKRGKREIHDAAIDKGQTRA
jgi:hypothetical protein